MFFLRILLLFSFCNFVLADHKNQVYNESSQLTVETINKVTEVLRDPTQMSGNFRQALKSLKPSAPVGDNGSSAQVPQIKLLGKVFVPKAAMKEPRPDSSSVILEINDQTLFLKEGAMSSIIKNEHLITISVEEITQHYVKLKIHPSNEMLILH